MLYTSRDQQPAYALRYTWCGWSSDGDLSTLQEDAWDILRTAWESDGLRLLERDVEPKKVLLTFSATPTVNPILLAARAKGRLQHAFRTSGPRPVHFSRKVAVRSIGDNVTASVQAYIEGQIRNAEFLDSRFAEFLEQFTIFDSLVDLSQPTETLSGRYWYNLHLVLVTDGRYRVVDEPSLATIRDGSFRIAKKKGYQIAAISVMPDHLHVAVRGTLEHSPDEVALAFQNNLAHMLNKGAIWRPGYYVGTFGEYNMDAIPRSLREKSVARSAPGRLERSVGEVERKNLLHLPDEPAGVGL